MTITHTTRFALGAAGALALVVALFAFVLNASAGGFSI